MLPRIVLTTPVVATSTIREFRPNVEGQIGFLKATPAHYSAQAIVTWVRILATLFYVSPEDILSTLSTKGSSGCFNLDRDVMNRAGRYRDMS